LALDLYLKGQRPRRPAASRTASLVINTRTALQTPKGEEKPELILKDVIS